MGQVQPIGQGYSSRDRYFVDMGSHALCEFEASGAAVRACAGGLMQLTISPRALLALTQA